LKQVVRPPKLIRLRCASVFVPPCGLPPSLSYGAASRRDKTVFGFNSRARNRASGMDLLAPARPALAGLWLRPNGAPALANGFPCFTIRRFRDQQTFRRFPNGSSAVVTTVAKRGTGILPVAVSETDAAQGEHRLEACATLITPPEKVRERFKRIKPPKDFGAGC